MDSQNNYQFSQLNCLGSENVMLNNSANAQPAFSSSPFPSQPLPHPMMQPNQLPIHFTPANLHFPRTYPMNPVSMPISPQIQQQDAPRACFQSLVNDDSGPTENQTLHSSDAPKKTVKTFKKSQTQLAPSSRRIWAIEEDVALTKAWLYISCDAGVGTGQKLGTLWDRILKAWRNNMGDYDPARNANGLGCRWGIIREAVTKFHGFYEQLERNPPSGTTPEQMKTQAYQMFKKEEKVPFKFEHCWEIMKNNPKWCTQQLTKQGASKTRKAADIEMLGDDTTNLGKLETGSTEVDGLRRPEGRKATKLMNKQKAIAEKSVIDVVSNLQSTLDKQFEFTKEELELKKEREKKEFELREQAIKDELEIKERNQKVKEKGQKLKAKAQKLKEKAKKQKNEESLVYRDLSNLQPALRKTLE